MTHPIQVSALPDDLAAAYLAHDARLRARGAVGPVPPVGTLPETAEALQRASAAVRAAAESPAGGGGTP